MIRNRNRLSRGSWVIILIGVLLLILNLLYFAECDELYFIAWKFDSLIDRLLSRPIQDQDYVIGIMHNGRLLGNFLGVLEGQLLNTEFWWLRALVFSLGLIVLAGG